jgi:hypothetical protein
VQIWVEDQLVFTVWELESPAPGDLVQVLRNQRFAKGRSRRPLHLRPSRGMTLDGERGLSRLIVL